MHKPKAYVIIEVIPEILRYKGAFVFSSKPVLLYSSSLSLSNEFRTTEILFLNYHINLLNILKTVKKMKTITIFLFSLPNTHHRFEFSEHLLSTYYRAIPKEGKSNLFPQSPHFLGDSVCVILGLFGAEIGPWS